MTAPVTERPHGRAKYVHEGCRCDVCTMANRRYASYQGKRKRIEEAGGRYDSGPWAAPFVPAQSVRDRIEAFAELGVGYKRLAELAGVGHTALFQVKSGARLRIRRETEAKVLAVPLVPDLAPGALVSSDETKRLLRVILRQTRWPKSRLARELGTEGAKALQLGKTPQVTRRTADAVAALGYRLMVDL